jgi:mannose-6-phosphate isomerase-like protein (cupin superfamily)
MKAILTNSLMAAGALLLFLCTARGMAQQSMREEPGTRAILQEFADAYQKDPMAMNATFGIRVGSSWWHVTSARKEVPYLAGKKEQYTFHQIGPHEVLLHEGPPEQPTWYFRFDNEEILNKIYQKALNTGTASAKSTGEDIVNFDIEEMEGFDAAQGDTALGYQVMEHFWKKDAAEVTRFSRSSSLPSHGAAIVSLYTMKDKRISWFSLGQEEVANGDPRLDKGQCPNLFIITKGRGKAQIGEQEIDLEPGMSVFVGPYVKHVLYNPNPEPIEGILVLFGDNIDYALGQSYVTFLEKQNAFYTENEEQVAAEKQQEVSGVGTQGQD